MIEEKDILEIQGEIIKFSKRKGILLLPSTYKKLFMKSAKLKGFKEDDCLKADKELAFENLAFRASAMKDEKIQDISTKIYDTKDRLVVDLDDEKKELEESIEGMKQHTLAGKHELSKKLETFTDKYSHLMHTIQSIKSNIEGIEESIKHVTEMSIQDPITLLGNCKYFEMSFDGELYTLKRYKTPISLMLLRMKNLNQIREKYGVSVERSVIKNIANITYENIRSTDMLFRCENGDFRMLLHNTNGEKAQIFAQKIKYILGRVVFQKNDERFKIDVSYGSTQLRESDIIESILKRVALRN